MRLWHKDLILYLPKQQLLGQWRELNSIFKNQNRHLLINFVYKRDISELFAYSILVIKEMNKKNYKVNLSYFDDYFFKYEIDYAVPYEDIYVEKMTDRYLKQCLYNLEEKAMCGGMTKEEWQVIYDKFGKEFDLWEWSD